MLEMDRNYAPDQKAVIEAAAALDTIVEGFSQGPNSDTQVARKKAKDYAASQKKMAIFGSAFPLEAGGNGPDLVMLDAKRWKSALNEGKNGRWGKMKEELLSDAEIYEVVGAGGFRDWETVSRSLENLAESL